MKLFISSLLFVFFFAQSAQAYVPPFWMILSKTADNHGKGIFLIEQDVTLRNESGATYKFKEQWLVENSQQMRVRSRGQIDGENFDVTYVYDNNRRAYYNSDKRRQIKKLTNPLVERFLVFRLSKVMRPFLYSQDIIPSSANRKRQPIYNLKNAEYKPEDFVKLDRDNGFLTYKISKSDTGPAIWVEQDQFNVRRARLQDGREFVAQDFKRYSSQLSYPKQIKLSWDKTKSAMIRITSVKPLGYSSFYKSRVRISGLNPQKDKHVINTSPSNPLIREFFSKFR